MNQNPQVKDSLLEELHALGPFFFLGCSGSGVKPLASFVFDLGIEVRGCDLKVSPSIRFPTFLESASEAKDYLAKARTVVYSGAVKEDHPLRVFARDNKINQLHRSDLLALITEGYKTISIAGTHGKSTTSALVTFLLRQLGAKPSWIIGASFNDHVPSYGVGEGEVLVIEADESDGSFLKFKTHIGLVNNVEADHLDYYFDFSHVKKAFNKFICQVSHLGFVITQEDDLVCQECLSDKTASSLTFGQNASSSLRISGSLFQGLQSVFNLSFKGASALVKLPLPGYHNILNASAATLCALALGYELKEIAPALSLFPGINRRLKFYSSTREDALIFDDYAHNPGKIFNCLQGLRLAFPERRILAVFQPHRFTRLSHLYEEFLNSFQFEHLIVIVLPVYGAGEDPILELTPQKIAADIHRSSKVPTHPVNSLKDAAELIKLIWVPKQDVLVTIGAGNVWEVAKVVAEDS